MSSPFPHLFLTAPLQIKGKISYSSVFLAACSQKLLDSFTDIILAAELQYSSEPQPFYEVSSDLKILMPDVFIEQILISWIGLEFHLPAATETKARGWAVGIIFSLALWKLCYVSFLQELGISAKHVTALSWNRITLNSFISVAFGCKMLIWVEDLGAHYKI